MQNVVINKTHDQKNSVSDESHSTLAEQFQAFYPRIYTYLRYRVNSPEDAEDLISIVFEQAYTRREQFDAAKGSFSSWIFRIAHNALVDYYRRRERNAVWVAETGLPPDLVMPGPSLETQIVQQETIARMLKSIKALNERDQEIISLKFAGALKNKEIAEIMNMKEKTVSVVLLRAMRRLRDEMKKGVSA